MVFATTFGSCLDRPGLPSGLRLRSLRLRRRGLGVADHSPRTLHSGAVLHRHRRPTHRLLAGGDQSGVPVELGLVHGDLPGQVRAGLGDPVRSVRDPPHHRLALLGATSPRQRGGLAFLICTGAPLVLGYQFAGRLLDPFTPTRPVTEVSRDTIRRCIAATQCRVRPRSRRSGLPSATMLAACWSNHSRPRLASIEAFAAILVPSIATVPNLPNPARAAIINTCANKSVNDLLRVDAEPGDRGVVRAVLGAQHPERHVA